ncbi:Nitric oxide-responding transcriptional regulator Dnr (Crp/Fnr family) [hydrothermal vent metagenome]|uniref:Nitric oxide-responding transcriptional regulator Dnr (Crp/Fnr family) n=1 Tax=hydrothermal vent metagenome TaxID=652676 RepID=A0A1W1CGE5_9ZZZZ
MDMASLVNDLMSDSNAMKKRINRSGKQRMLTQRMTKLAILISLNIDKDKNQKSLLKFAKLYNDTLAEFKAGNSDLGFTKEANIKIEKQIAVVEELWKDFFKNVKILAEGKDKEDKALNYVTSHNQALLKESNNLVSLYEKSNTSQNYMEKAMVKIVNLAGRQRMLTQKMTNEKLMCVKGEKEYKKSLIKTIKLFDESLDTLINGNTSQKIPKPSNKKIKEQLAKVKKLWDELKPLYENWKPDAKTLAIIIKKNPILLKEMNKMVSLAEQETEY